MGCCLSTLEPNKAKPSSLDDNKTHQFSCESKSPPRPEEETVKEVLSETPKPKPNLQLELEPEPETEVAKVDEEPKKPNITVSPKKATLEKKVQSLEKRQHYNPEPSTPEEISEVSEICSLSETISNTTLEDQQQQWGVKDSATSRVYRSQGHSGNLMYHNNGYNHGHQNPNVQLRRNHGRSPVRPGRANPSPPRRPGPAQGPGRVGENSARRSRSPVTRGNVSRSPSAKRGGPSPGRVRMVNGPGHGHGHGPESVRKADEENDREDGGPKESLENPLVSLECFIFL